MTTCCLNCEDRHKNCHSECAKYIDWKKESDIKQAKIRASKTKYWETDGIKIKQIERATKRKRG